MGRFEPIAILVFYATVAAVIAGAFGYPVIQWLMGPSGDLSSDRSGTDSSGCGDGGDGGCCGGD